MITQFRGTKNIATVRLCGCRNSYNVKTIKFAYQSHSGFLLSTDYRWSMTHQRLR